MEKKVLSCGVIVIDNNKKILMIHSASQNFWDVPKGTQKSGETTFATAIRVVNNEVGLDLSGEKLIDLGWYPYNKHKDLYLYLFCIDKVELEDLSCNSFFVNNDGDRLLVADEFNMVDSEEFLKNACHSMARLYESTLRKDIEIMLKRKVI